MSLKKTMSESTWECVHFCEPSAVPELDELVSVGFRTFELDAQQIGTKTQLLEGVAQAMGFPDYFGVNWDALDESLRDMAWSPARGYVLVVRNAEDLWCHNAKVAGGLLQSWLFSAEKWSREDIPFHLIFVW